MKFNHPLTGLALLTVPVLAHANMVWPSIYLEERMFTWWGIVLGLVIEYPFVRHLFGLAPSRALTADVAANVVSAVAGIALIPVSGMFWETGPGTLYRWAFGWEPFGGASLAGAFIMACITNAAVEGLAYRYLVKVPFRFRSRAFLWLVLANAGSIAVAFASLWVSPLRPLAAGGPV